MNLEMSGTGMYLPAANLKSTFLQLASPGTVPGRILPGKCKPASFWKTVGSVEFGHDYTVYCSTVNVCRAFYSSLLTLRYKNIKDDEIFPRGVQEEVKCGTEGHGSMGVVVMA